MIRRGDQNGKMAQAEGVPDPELVLAARRGEKRAFVEIVARHQAMVCGVALGILGDFAASEDAAQEAFLTAWRRIHDLREPEKLKGWLCQIARNAALGHLRRTRGSEPIEVALALQENSPGPDEQAATEEEAALVRDALAKLPENYRLPLVLFYREGNSVSAVASTLGLSEDAVKQRLARGREMLRERMSGLVEEVLGRTRPNAVFTMTIAAAIGALAAPSLIAASAFAAGSATGAALGTTTGETVLTAMSTSKVLIGTAALVAVICIPIGYELGEGANQPPNAATAPETNSVTMTNAPTFAESALFAEWRALHEKYGTTAEAMPLLYEAIKKLEDPFRRRAFRTALLSEWVEVDASGGLKFLSQNQSEFEFRQPLLAEWLKRDASGAADQLIATRDWDLTREVLAEIARLAPNRIPEIVSQLPKSESFWDTRVREAFAIVAEGNLENARKAAETLQENHRDQALSGVAKTWAKTDLDAALKWIGNFPEGADRDEAKRCALMGRANVDPVAALDQLGLVPPGGRFSYFASTTGARVLSEAASANFDQTVQWLVANPGRTTHEDLMGLANEVTRRLNEDPIGFLNSYGSAEQLKTISPAISSALLNQGSGQRRAVWEWLKTQGENDGTRSVRETVLSSAGYQEPELALKLAEELPAEDRSKGLNTVASSLLNGGSMLHRFDALYAKAPEGLRAPLMEKAFQYLRGDNLSDPREWIERLDRLPQEKRVDGSANIARAWADQAPEEAMNWVATWPVGEAKSAALERVVSTWAYKDATTAANWVTEMAPGSERDRSSQALVNALADKYPREAWQWALQIGDQNSRREAAASVVQGMSMRDPNTAREWIESGPFDAEMQAKLLSSMQVFASAKERSIK